MRFYWVFIVLLFVVFFMMTNLWLFVPDLSGLTVEDFSIARVKLFDTDQDVIKKLGEPCKKESEFESWVYKGLEIEVWQGDKTKRPRRVDCIKITDNSYKTHRGIRVGDSIQDVYNKYGKIKGSNIEHYTLSYRKMMSNFQNPLLSYSLNFTFDKDKVIEITSTYNTD